MKIYYNPLAYKSFNGDNHNVMTDVFFDTTSEEKIRKFYRKLSELKVKIYFNGIKTGWSKDYVDWFKLSKIKGYEHLTGYSIEANSSMEVNDIISFFPEHTFIKCDYNPTCQCISFD